LMEITMNNLLAAGELNAEDFLSRVDLLADIGFTVLISNYSEYYRLTSYFRRYTKEMIGVAMGINNLLEVFNEKYYDHLEGGILEAFGRLFRNAVKLYIYPMQQTAYDRYVAGQDALVPHGANHAFASGVLITAKNLQVAGNLRNLYAHLLENHNIDCIVGFDPTILHIFSRDVLERLRHGDVSWERMVPDRVVEAIKKRNLFGAQPDKPSLPSTPLSPPTVSMPPPVAPEPVRSAAAPAAPAVPGAITPPPLPGETANLAGAPSKPVK